jgi:hypothetical protein
MSTTFTTSGEQTQELRYTIGPGNDQTGKMLTITAERRTCPPSCAFYDDGCYALYGKLRINWPKVFQRGMELAQLVLEIMAYGLRMSRLLKVVYARYGQAGDLPGEGEEIDAKAVKTLAKAARQGKVRLFGYTHKPMTKANKKIVKWANENGFVINLSANGLKDADRLANLGIAPVAVAVADTSAKYTPEGKKIAYCPTKMGVDIQCDTCGLCAIAERKAIIGFPAHGTGKNHVKRIVEALDLAA